MWLWSCSCASACPRFSTCGPRSPTSSAGNSANWLKQPPGRSKPASFCPTAAFASPRMAVSAAPIWDSAWETSGLSRPNSSANPEPATLIGLTSLTTNGRPLLPPKLNRRRALLVLAKIEEILAWEQTTEQERETRFAELGRYLCEVRAGQYWRLDNLGSFDEFLERRFPGSRRKAYYLMAIHEHLPRIPKPELKLVGWTKATELVKVARRDGHRFDSATWLHRARELPKEEFKREVERHLTGQETEPWEIIYFKLYKSQLPVIEQALETAALMLGTEKSRGYCLEMICADFLAGANLDLENGNRNALLLSMRRLLGFLPHSERQQFLKQVSDVHDQILDKVPSGPP